MTNVTSMTKIICKQSFIFNKTVKIVIQIKIIRKIEVQNLYDGCRR